MVAEVIKGTQGLRAGQLVKVLVLNGVQGTVKVETSRGRIVDDVLSKNLKVSAK